MSEPDPLPISNIELHVAMLGLEILVLLPLVYRKPIATISMFLAHIQIQVMATQLKNRWHAVLKQREGAKLEGWRVDDEHEANRKGALSRALTSVAAANSVAKAFKRDNSEPTIRDKWA
jgi:hypothetical protein